MKITFLDAATVGETSLSPIAVCGDLTAWPTSSPEEAKERVKDCEVLVVNKVKVTEDLLGVAPNVKLVCEAGTGINNIDVKACEKRGIIVRNVGILDRAGCPADIYACPVTAWQRPVLR